VLSAWPGMLATSRGLPALNRCRSWSSFRWTALEIPSPPNCEPSKNVYRRVAGNRGGRCTSSHKDEEDVMPPAGMTSPNGECYGHHMPTLSLRAYGGGLIGENHMKAKLAIIGFGALVLMANGANAQHGTGSQTHLRYLSRTFGQAASGIPYESYSQGRQSYPNPDRELYVNRSCC
jgi:hypothetical protein